MAYTGATAGLPHCRLTTFRLSAFGETARNRRIRQRKYRCLRVQRKRHRGDRRVGQTRRTAAIIAFGATASSPALEVNGKVKFNRAGRKTIGAGKSTLVVNMAGVTSTSKVLAVLNSNRSGRYVRAVVPATGKFTIYLNSSVSSSTYVAYFVFD